MYNHNNKNEARIRLVGARVAGVDQYALYVVVETASCDFFQLMSNYYGDTIYFHAIKIWAAQFLTSSAPFVHFCSLFGRFFPRRARYGGAEP
eukprot:4420131-Pyramimonas_sp.AAC.1